MNNEDFLWYLLLLIIIIGVTMTVIWFLFIQNSCSNNLDCKEDEKPICFESKCTSNY